MSGNLGFRGAQSAAAGGPQRLQPRAQLPLLDRLIDNDPGELQDRPMSSSEALEVLRSSVRRDLEALLNARRPWRRTPPALAELPRSPLGFGLPDLSAGAQLDPKRREAFRIEVEDTIRRFEPRLARLKVTLQSDPGQLESTLRLRVDGVLHADPAPEPVAFDTVIDLAMSEVTVATAPDV